MLGYLEQENVVFGLTPAPAWSESPTFSADSIGRLPKYDSSNSSKSYPYKQYSKGPKIIRRVLSKEL